MKNIFVFILISLLANNYIAHGQFFSDNRDNLVLSTKRDLDNKTINLNNSGGSVDLSDVKGSPYAKETFSQGKVLNKKLETSYPYFLRYNVYNDIIEIKNENQSVELIKSPNIYAKFNNKEYHFEEYLSDPEEVLGKGYFVLLQGGEKYKLYVKNIKKFTAAVKAETAYNKNYPATFTDFEEFYIKDGNKRLVTLKKRKKQFLQQVPSISKEVEQYIKTEKTDLDSEEDLIALFEYMNSLLK